MIQLTEFLRYLKASLILLWDNIKRSPLSNRKLTCAVSVVGRLLKNITISLVYLSRAWYIVSIIHILVLQKWLQNFSEDMKPGEKPKGQDRKSVKLRSLRNGVNPRKTKVTLVRGCNFYIMITAPKIKCERVRPHLKIATFQSSNFIGVFCKCLFTYLKSKISLFLPWACTDRERGLTNKGARHTEYNKRARMKKTWIKKSISACYLTGKKTL